MKQIKSSNWMEQKDDDNITYETMLSNAYPQHEFLWTVSS